MSEPTSIELEIPGHRIAGIRWDHTPAHPQTPIVLALHGWLDNAASFSTLAPMVRGARVCAVDLPGHGRSTHKPLGSCYHFVDAVADAAAIVDALGAQTIFLLGHSMGAGISTLLAGMWPDRIAGVCLVEGLGPLTDTQAHAPTRLAASLEAQSHRRADRRRVFQDLKDAAQRLELAQGVTTSSAIQLATRGTEPFDGGVRWRSDPRLRIPSRIRFTEDQVLAFIGAITAPVTLIRARDGFAFNKSTMQSRIDAASSLQLVEVDGGHHVHLDHPERVIPALQTMIDRHNASLSTRHTTFESNGAS